jgi:hypothetical protein
MHDLDYNHDAEINVGDLSVDDDEMALWMANCDADNNMTIDFCELHDCLLREENEFRINHNCEL